MMDNNNFLKLVDLLEQALASNAALSASQMAERLAFEQIISELKGTIEELNKTIGVLLEENRLLKGPKKNSGNSSIAPSKDENPIRKTNSLRKPSGKSSGGQSGHPGSTLEMRSCVDLIINHNPDFCSCCGLGLGEIQAELHSRRQVVDIPVIKPLYTEHRVFHKTCSCGCKTSSDFPVGVDAPISYGPQTTALIAYLHSRQYVSLARIAELFNSVYSLPISQGTICGILDRFVGKASSAFDLIKAAICNAAVIGSDETGMKNNGKLRWFWVWQSESATYIIAAQSRGKETVQAHFPNGFPEAIMIHDCWPAQLNTLAKGHQICIAHLLRELEFFKQKYKCPWAERFSQMLTDALGFKKNMQPQDYLRPLEIRVKLEAELEALLKFNVHQNHREVRTFQKRIVKLKDCLFTFLYHHSVPPDNNASERAIRNIKVKQKVSGMFKSLKGAQNYAIIRSITDTCIKNAQSVLNEFLIIAQAP